MILKFKICTSHDQAISLLSLSARETLESLHRQTHTDIPVLLLAVGESWKQPKHFSREVPKHPSTATEEYYAAGEKDGVAVYVHMWDVP